ncbi:MAG: class I SAM-dependent methyltransferase [Planctomycetia bacterium]|nr:class I SAM-dependent methyltransferase [Planctomycetia bacterium]
MGQILEILRIIGLKRAARMKKRFDDALPHLRGHAVTSSLWMLLRVGLLDEMLARGQVDLRQYCSTNQLEPQVIDAVCEYLDGLSMVRVEDGKIRLLRKLSEMLEEPRGFLELAYAYDPVFHSLEDLARGKVKYGEEVHRRVEYVGRGSGMLCRTLPYPVMADIIRRHERKRILDLGCGDLSFLFFLCENSDDITGLGIDIDGPMVEVARELLKKSPWSQRLAVEEADMFRLEAIAQNNTDVDCITAVDTLHEYLIEGDSVVVDLLKQLRREFPRAVFVVGEFCKQPHERLRKHPTAFLEHHLYHRLTKQRIVDAGSWLRIFAEAGLDCVEKKVFDIVGHGYFVLS